MNARDTRQERYQVIDPETGSVRTETRRIESVAPSEPQPPAVEPGVREYTAVEEVAPSASELEYERRARIRQIAYYILDVIEVLLLGRFLLRLFGANPASGFTAFVYRLTDPLMAPFRGIFPTTADAGSVFEWSVLVAMAVYALIAYAIVHFLMIGAAPVDGPRYRRSETARHTAV